MLEDVKSFFEISKKSIMCNTSYPLSKYLWNEFQSKSEDLFKKDRDMSIYIHIPFCKSLCTFCEYTRFKKRNKEDERLYLHLLENEVKDFLASHKIDYLYGFDIGGGTPTVLDNENFKSLMDIVKLIEKDKKFVSDYEKSIEATFSTINEFKIKEMVKAGFKRISFGVQSVSKEVLNNYERELNPVFNMKSIMNMAKTLGIEKINLDFMYGLKGQNQENLKDTIELIKILNPEHVTLYETRYNTIDLKSNISREELFDQYSVLYNGLIKLGYSGRFGQNTFSKFKDDGLSSYLRYRVKDFIPYKGFGISAQSLSSIGESYNVGKNEKIYEKCIKNNIIYPDDIYILSKEELIAKYVAISLYYGIIDIDVINKILGTDSNFMYKNIYSFLIENNLVIKKGNKLIITKEGFKYYGGIGALFYSDEHKKYLAEVLYRKFQQITC